MLGDASIHVPGQNQCGWLCGASGRVSAHRQAWPSSHITRWWWGERAETLQCQNIQAHTPSPLSNCSLHPHLLTRFFPSPFPPHLPLSLSVSDNPGTVKSSELSGGMSDNCVEQSAEHTHWYGATHTFMRLILALLFSEKLRETFDTTLDWVTLFIIKNNCFNWFLMIYLQYMVMNLQYTRRELNIFMHQITKRVYVQPLCLSDSFPNPIPLHYRAVIADYNTVCSIIYLHGASPSLGGVALPSLFNRIIAVSPCQKEHL